MFSNSSLKMIFSSVVAASIVLAGCSVKVGEQPPPPKAQELNGTKCLSKISPYLSDFIDGKSSAAEVTETWDCFSGALDKFRRYVRGSASDRYTVQELATFMQDNFLDNSQGAKVISPALQDELMKLKQMFVGGSHDFLTMADLDQAMDLISSLRGLALGINPYMKVFSLNWSPSAQEKADVENQYFEAANQGIQDFAKGLSALIQKNHQGYVLTDFVVLCREMSNLDGKPWASLAAIEKYMPVVQKIKQAISGGLETTVAPNEWRSFLLLSARGYVQFLRYHYFISEAKDQDRGVRLGFSAQMIEDVFSVFQDLVKEKPTGVVTRAELGDLLTTLSKAWTEFKTSDRLVLEVMKVKQLFIGGTADAFTVNDFANAGLKTGKLKILVEKALPYLDIYGSQWNPDKLDALTAQNLFQQAQVNLTAILSELGSLLEGDYDVDSFSSLVNEIVHLYPQVNDGREQHLDETVKKIAPIVVDLKNMAFHASGSVILKAQWSGFLSSVAGGYAVFLYHDYFMKKIDLQTSLGLNRLGSLVDQSVQVLRSMMGLNAASRFSLDDINSLGKKLIAADLLPDKVDSEVIRIGLNVLVNRVLLAPELRLRGKYPSALNMASLDNLSFEVKVWLEQESFFASLFKSDDDAYSLSQIQHIFSERYKQPGLSKELNTGLYEMIIALDSGVPMTLTPKGYLIISGKLSQRYRQDSLSRLNLSRTIARILTHSYVNDLGRITSYRGLNLSEAQQAFKELRPAAVRMGLVDPNATSFAESRFREANIFVPSANGDDYMSFKEATQLVSMIWSGVSLNHALADELKHSCLGGHSYSNSTLVSVDCVTQVYDREMRVYLKASLPEHVKYMNAIGSDVWGTYLTGVLKAAGFQPNSSGKAKMGDIALAPHVIQYIEMMFAKFDQDNNYFIDTKEALQAFPTFRSLIKTFAAGAVGDNDLDSVFTYILRYGKPPETPYEKLQFISTWKGQPGNWNVQAERTQLAKILGYIADQTSGSSSSHSSSTTQQAPASAQPAPKPRSANPHQI